MVEVEFGLGSVLLPPASPRAPAAGRRPSPQLGPHVRRPEGGEREFPPSGQSTIGPREKCHHCVEYLKSPRRAAHTVVVAGKSHGALYL